MIKTIIQKAASQFVPTLERWAYKPFYSYPFGKAPRAEAERYTQIWNDAKSKSYGVIDDYEKTSGHAIEPEWFHKLALLTQVVIKKSDICYQHGRLLYSTLAKYLEDNTNENITILETGTARGFSSLCMAKAMNDSRATGRIVTFDVLPHDVKMFWNCIADENGPQSRAELLKEYAELTARYIIFHQGDTKLELKKVKFPRVHFAFLDGAHTYSHVLREFNAIKDHQQPGDIIFFDDYTPKFFPGIVKAVDEICLEHNYSKRVITVSEQRGYVVAVKQ